MSISINKIKYKYLFMNSLELYDFMKKNSALSKSFIKVAEDNFLINRHFASYSFGYS